MMPFAEQAIELLPDDLAAHARELTVAKNSYLFHCGDPIDQLYFVREGELRALRHQANGQKAVMMRARSGEFFAAASLSMGQFPCDGLAPVATRLWSLPRADFNQALSTSAPFAEAFSLALSMELKKQCGRLERMRLPTARERILHYIACETRDGQVLDLDTPLNAWAEELGIEPESLYRTLAEMESSGQLSRDRRHIEILANSNE